jgi:hypothetical protein
MRNPISMLRGLDCKKLVSVLSFCSMVIESKVKAWTCRALLWGPALALSLAFSVPVSGQSDIHNSTSWSGVIINSGCTPDEAFAEAAKCTDKVPGGKLVLYDDTTRQIFDLDPQDKAIGHLGDGVTVAGALEGNSIHVSFLELLTSIGLPVGRKAPAFSLSDQSGHEQTLDSLKGPHGTVLLFFRSADW